ncbi:MAG: hypothetical protein KAT00_00110 [Planctomycetes bacterium]|nr:hypothetical protein [Planctomycetota bacterium]
MALPAFQSTIQNSAGDIIPSAVITVLVEATGTPAVLFSDRAGTISLGTLGVFNATVDGFAQFYAAPGEYRVTASDSGTGFTQTWRYVPLSGTAAFAVLGSGAGEVPVAENVVLQSQVGTDPTDIPQAQDVVLQSQSHSAGFMTYGGTADVVTLTSIGTALTALTDGDVFRFDATAVNTGAMTINVDGLGAKAVKTVTLVATPADYVRNDTQSVCRYDLANDWFVLSREIEKGAGYTRFETGKQGATVSGLAGDILNVADGALFTQAALTVWTYPAAFYPAPPVVLADVGTSTRWAAAASPTVSSCSLRGFAATSAPAGIFNAIADGGWY